MPVNWAPARSASSSWSAPPRIIRTLPAGAKGAVLAAHATPEGHWKFANKDGDVFTAGTPEELQRVVPTLLPEATPGGSLGIYLSEDTLFADRALLKDLPPGAKLYVVAGADSYPLVARGGELGTGALYAAVRPNLLVELRDRSLLAEAIAQLERPLSRSSIRTLALEPGGPGTLSSYPRLDAETKAALVDAIDPPLWPARCPRCAGRRYSSPAASRTTFFIFAHRAVPSRASSSPS